MLASDFPQVKLICNSANQGFTAPMNQALREGQGRYLLLLNPDTMIYAETFDALCRFMEDHPKAGACGPKVLNVDGTLQGPCRRGEPRPMAVIGYFSGLGKLYPQNRALNEYLLSYLPEDERAVVAGVSGSCMLVRRAVVDKIGYMDETFFAYQEDADYCARIRLAGWQVYYVPEARILHYGGRGGSRVEPWRSIVAWHRSYWLYYRKYLAGDYPALFNGVYYLLIGVKLLSALAANLFRHERYAGPRR